MTQEQKKLCLIDGSGYIYRAFYAIPSMTRPSDKKPVNAVYGFTSMLMQFFKDNQSDYLAVVFDAQRHNFRNDIYHEYKATRKEVPPNLIPQFSLIRQAVQAFNVASVEQEGFEADDLIASYAQKALSQGMEVIIVSADKDLMQLMVDNVSIYDPIKKRVLTLDDVVKKFGVSPKQVVDVQSLAGDSSDNVPGIKGIGFKTASEFINQFGTLENLFKNVNSIVPGHKKELIIQGREMAMISKRLVTLCGDAPLPLPIENFCARMPNEKNVRTFLEENGFKSLLPRINDFVSMRTKTVQSCEQSIKVQPVYECVQDKKTLLQWVEKIKQAKVFAVDTETDSLNPLDAELAGISLCVKEGEACYIPLRHMSETGNNRADLFDNPMPTCPIKQVSIEDIKTFLFPIFKDPYIAKIGHNIKFDLQVLKTTFGQDFEMNSIQDTMVMAYDANGVNQGLSMDDLADVFLNIKTIRFEDVCGKGKNAVLFKYVPLEKAVVYASEDADITLRLYHYFAKKLKSEQVENVYQCIDLPLIPVLERMEKEGVLVDKTTLIRLSFVFAQKMESLEKEIYTLAEERFNINSPSQLGEILFEKMKLQGGKKNIKTNSWSTGKDTLEMLAENGAELPLKILEYRQYSKLKSTYTDALINQINQRTGRVHTTFSQTVTTTGRLASNNPNLQNIPIRTEDGRLIRSAFIAKKGCVLLSADYSQIELRLIADVAQVQELRRAFEIGADIHTVTASQVFHIPLENVDPLMRRRAKAINFGIIYGISAFGLANQLGMSRTEAKQYIDSYMEKYAEIKIYMNNTIQFAKENGYVVTPFGRKCFIQGFDNERTKGFASRSAINAPIQGGAADMIKMAMNKMDDALLKAGLKTKMLLQVHDELVFETPLEEIEKASVVIRDIMENVVTLSVPLKVEIGTGENWTEAH